MDRKSLTRRELLRAAARGAAAVALAPMPLLSLPPVLPSLLGRFHLAVRHGRSPKNQGDIVHVTAPGAKVGSQSAYPREDPVLVDSNMAALRANWPRTARR